MRIVDFEPWHLLALDVQPAQIGFEAAPDMELARELADAGPSWTGTDGRQVLFCGGMRRAGWPGQAMGWTLISAAIGPFGMLALTRRTLLEHARSGFRRIETLVRTDHAEGHRWAEQLGMTREGTMRAWGPAGVDHDIYAKVAL